MFSKYPSLSQIFNFMPRGVQSESKYTFCRWDFCRSFIDFYKKQCMSLKIEEMIYKIRGKNLKTGKVFQPLELPVLDHLYIYVLQNPNLYFSVLL